MVRILCVMALVAGVASRVAAAQTVTVAPKQPFIERTRAGQSLSIDFLIDNPGPGTLELVDVRLQVFDQKGDLVLRKQAWAGIDAALPATRTVAPRHKLLVLAPFHLFDPSIELGKLAYELVFELDDKARARKVVPVTVVPRAFRPKTSLALPVPGHVLVYEGHDFYAHHRRVDLTHPLVGKLGVTDNPTRYAYDLCVADAQGNLFARGGKRAEDWLGFGTPIVAPGAGTVTEIRNDVDDNVFGEKMFDPGRVVELAATDRLAANRLFLGNYVVIDHGSGEVSLLAHLKKGSVTVKPGESVKAGRHIADMGMSGDADFVHLHYQLMRGMTLDVETLPLYFDKLEVRRGKRMLPSGDVALDSGDFVQSAR